ISTSCCSARGWSRAAVSPGARNWRRSMPSDEMSGNARQEAQSPVVTCCVLRSRDGHDEVLLAQSSQRVRTYRGAWGCVSSYLEPGVTPLEQAYTELREEAGLA